MPDHSPDDLLAPRPADPVILPPGGRSPKPEPDATDEPLVRITVQDGTQVNLAGTVHPGGSTLSAPASLAAEWIAYGWVTAAATPDAPAKAKRK